ncbi:MAG: hypothetical protein U0Q22_03440 [Acidimicrobiales bacterium]
MSHMVIFQTPDGNPGYNQFETVDESIGFVEKLRNEQNVLNARIFKLEELKFEFKPYFRVQLAMLNAGDAPAAAAPAAPTTAPAPAATPFAAAPAGGDAPAAPAPQGAPVSNIDSPVGRPAGAPTDPPVAAPLPNGSSFAGAPAEDDRGRRGLFGR